MLMEYLPLNFKVKGKFFSEDELIRDTKAYICKNNEKLPMCER